MPRPIHWVNGEFVDWFYQRIHKYWYLETFQNWSPRGSQTWVRCQNWAVHWAANSLYPALIWWITDAQRLWCARLSSLNLFYLSASLCYTLCLLLSSLSLLPGASCASSHIFLLSFTPFVYSLYLSHLILSSSSSLLSSLKSVCLSHPLGNKHCLVSLKGGVWMCV